MVTLRRVLFRQLQRKTTSGAFIPEIDGLRCWCILSVVLYHLVGYVALNSGRSFEQLAQTNILARSTANGYRGVYLFFIISGFVLALPFANWHFGIRPAVPLRAYFMRRLTRLEPPFVVAMLFCTAILYVTGFENVSAPHLGAALLYLHNLIYGYPNPINGITWSLEIEVQFYILAPLLTTVFSIERPLVRRSVLVAAGIAAMLLQIVFIRVGSRFDLTLINYLQYFLAGFLLADLYLCEQVETLPRAWIWDVVALGTLLAITVIPHGEVEHILLPVFGSVLCCAAFRGRIANTIFRNPWITTLGGMCYSIYLLHNPVISGASRVIAKLVPGWLPFSVSLVLQTVVILPSVLIITVVFYVLVERPCMARDWPQRAMRFVRRSLGIELPVLPHVVSEE